LKFRILVSIITLFQRIINSKKKNEIINFEKELKKDRIK